MDLMVIFADNNSIYNQFITEVQIKFDITTITKLTKLFKNLGLKGTVFFPYYDYYFSCFQFITETPLTKIERDAVVFMLKRGGFGEFK